MIALGDGGWFTKWSSAGARRAPYTLQVTISWDLAKKAGRLAVAARKSEHVLIRHFAMTRCAVAGGYGGAGASAGLD